MKKTNNVVSVKLDDIQKSELLLQAESEGLTLSQFLRKKLNEDKSQGKPVVAKTEETAAPAKMEVTAGEISIQSLISIDEIVKENLSTIGRVAPEREYLKKIAGQSTENPDTLSFEEEEFLKKLSEGIKAETTEGLLQEHNSVPISPLFHNDMQRRFFKEMLEKRNEVISEKLQSFNQIFMQAIGTAFLDDCKILYNRNLFKATYGFNYDEFKAVFEVE